METPIVKRTLKSKIPVSPLSPSLRPKKAQTPKSIIKQQEKAIVSIEKSSKNIGVVEDKFAELGIKFLDFGENKIKPDALKSINPQCVCLNLNKIELTPSKIPLLRDLRSLSLENCNLKSLIGFPKLENLRYLSLKDNLLENYEGLPILKNLESLNIENNKTDFPAEFSLSAFGSIALQEYNGEEIPVEIYQKAFSFSPIVGYALRSGLNPELLSATEDNEENNQVDAEKTAIDFLTKDLVQFMQECQVECRNKLIIKRKENNFCIICPYKADSIKWYLHDNSPFETNEWQLIKGESNDSIPITLNMRMHIIRCEISMDNRTFFIYTQQPVGRDKNELCLPYPLTPELTGITRDSFILSVNNIGIPAYYTWTSGDNTIAEDVTCISLTTDLVGKQISCEVTPYFESNPKIEFCSYFALSNTVMSLQPTISGIEFPETIIEYEPIQFNAIFFGGTEGDSEIYLEKSKFQYEEFVKECQLTKDELEVIPESHVVGMYLRISYTPITSSGTKGQTKYFYSTSRVLPSVPQFVDPFIAGSPKTHHSLAACATYVGGVRGECIYKWYVSDAPIQASRKGVRNLPVVSNGQIFIPQDEHIDMFVAVEMTPVRVDECVGDPVFASLETCIQMDKQPETIETTGKVFLNNKFVFEQDYDFSISDSSQPDGFALVKQGPKFNPKEDYIGRMLRISNQTTDTIMGEIVPAEPEITEMTLSDVDDGIVRLNVKAKGISFDRMEVVWFRVCNDVTKAVAIDTPDYVLTPDDVNNVVFAVVALFDENRALIKKYTSEKTRVITKPDLLLPSIVGTMIEGSNCTIESDVPWEKVTWYRSNALTSLEVVSTEKEYTLTAADVGSLIKAQVTILQQNKGANGGYEKFAVMTQADEYVRLYFPSIKVTAPAEIFEGERITPEVTSGDPEKYNKFQYQWYRKSEYGELTLLAETADYIPKFEDIGMFLMFSVAAYGSDNRTTGPTTTIDIGPVVAHAPVAEKVKIFQGENGRLQVKYNYYGGEEGQTEVEWVIVSGKNLRSIGKTKQKTIVPLPNMFDRNISAVVTPKRSDGVVGNPVLAESPVTVKPLPIVESGIMLVKNGKLVSGSLFRVKVKAANHKGIRYQWFRSGYDEWEIIEGETGVEYAPTAEDVDKLIKCEVVAFNNDGWECEPYIVETQRTVGDGTGLILVGLNGGDISTVGTVLHTNLPPDEAEKTVTFEVHSGNELIDEIQDSQMLVNANHIGCKIRARSTNGLMTSFTEEIQMPKKVGSFVSSYFRTGTFKFTAASTVGNSLWSCTCGQSGMSMISKNGVKKIAKWKTVKVSANQHTIDEMELWVDQSTKFVLIPEPSLDTRAQGSIPAELKRDFTICLINMFKSKYSQ